MEISRKHRWRRLTPDDAHYFFGYYDRNPWDPAQQQHLVLKVAQCEHLPHVNETAEIGILDRHGNYRPQTVTRAWNHQQGAMELFLPRRPGHFIYNDFDTEAKKMVCRIFAVDQGVVGTFADPVYAITRDGRYGVSLDFGRIPRRGYSYADATLPPDLWPDDLDRSGIKLIDLETGASRLIASYRTMIERHPFGYGLPGKRLWLNHAIFNCDGTRLLWLLRQCDDNNRSGVYWRTFMYTCAIDGGDVECTLPDVYWSGNISHQIWGRTPREILVDANWNGEGFEAVVFDESRRPLVARRISHHTGKMGHMVFSPDGSRLLADSYPDGEGFQTLTLIDSASGEYRELGRFRHQQPPGTTVDVRCDLHPRWSPDGRTVTVDSIHEGRRAVYLLEL